MKTNPYRCLPMLGQHGILAYLFQETMQNKPLPDPETWESPPFLTWCIDDPGGKRILAHGHHLPAKGGL